MSNERPKRFLNLPIRVPQIVFDAAQTVVRDSTRDGYVTNRTDVLREVLIRWAVKQQRGNAKP